MTKNQLISVLSKRTGIEVDLVRTVIDTFSNEVAKQLMEGESVHMRGFGTFAVKHYAQKMARNINKKHILIVPAHDQPVFKAADRFRQDMKEKTKKEVVLPL